MAFCNTKEEKVRKVIKKRIGTDCCEVNLNAFQLNLRSFLVINMVRNRNTILDLKKTSKLNNIKYLIVYFLKV